MVTIDNIANRAFLELSEAAKTAASDALKHRYGYRGLPVHVEAGGLAAETVIYLSVDSEGVTLRDVEPADVYYTNKGRRIEFTFDGDTTRRFADVLHDFIKDNLRL